MAKPLLSAPAFRPCEQEHVTKIAVELVILIGSLSLGVLAAVGVVRGTPIQGKWDAEGRLVGAGAAFFGAWISFFTLLWFLSKLEKKSHEITEVVQHYYWQNQHFTNMTEETRTQYERFSRCCEKMQPVAARLSWLGPVSLKNVVYYFTGIVVAIPTLYAGFVNFARKFHEH